MLTTISSPVDKFQEISPGPGRKREPRPLQLSDTATF